ncbi:type II toxin-antitoxin system PemK/MazF family toxin [Cyanothece sp. BG0011]|uniref:type II toxin-antitoxin system PemK/MazF family toxin n=1 Tax=Cyanothece sp. BG0011 TaxID=2082950 RepID=UPI000D1F730B|nr:type II toxin-antitoxin system PemK/MazF family toxin [Cyanothece sp. BG0011]
MSLEKGDIVLVPFPFTDLSTSKLRPAVVLWVDSLGFDITVCFISSHKINSISLEEFIIKTTDPEFSLTGSKVNSKVRVSRIITIQRNLITRKIGTLGPNFLKELDRVLRVTFKL